jgi:hypothetical protein
MRPKMRPKRIGTFALAVALVIVPSWSSAVVKKRARQSQTKKAAALNVADSFQAFCGVWMKKLRARETDNIAHIEWQNGPDSVWGSYVGYSEDYTCAVTSGPRPVGRMNYREVRYEKRGASLTEAKDSTPRPVEIFETSELFSYIRGKWDY